jgi:[protein-PII] uridylyltransferase
METRSMPGRPSHGEPDGFTKSASQRFLYSLWDLRFEVGYGIRDAEACEKLAAEDHTARTALLDLRLLAGDRELYGELEREQLHGLSQTRIDGFIAEKIAEMHARREKFGDSIYLLEPNVKQSEGGLRDLQSALWIARARFKVAGITDLLSRALLPEREVAQLKRARDFIWRVRNELHYLAGRKSDELSFDVQPQIAELMGYRDSGHRTAVEEFMRHYYLAAKTVLVACDAIVDRSLEVKSSTGWRRARTAASTIGAEEPPANLAREWHLPGGELKVFRGRLTITDKDVLRSSPAALMRLFAAADREGLELYPYARDQAAQAAAELGPEAAADPEVGQELLAALLRPGTRGRFLTQMHQLGVLEKVLPEFSRITARRQIDIYHVYTVDIHSLFAVRRLLALRCGDIQEQTLTKLMQEVERPLPVYLATLFHDIGKGGGPDHSTRGAAIAVSASVRMGLDPADAADIEWLVAKHLRMVAISQRRDLSDPDLIHAFAEECGVKSRLDALYLLSYADIATVGPHTWNEWKARLLQELYEKTREVLAADETRPAPGTAESAGRGEVARVLSGYAPDDEVLRFVEAMPARYFLTVPPKRAPRHLRLLRLGRNRSCAMVIRHQPALGCSEIALTAEDRKGLLATIAGVFAAHRIDIQHAEVFSTPNVGALDWLAGRALDLFQVRGPEEGALERKRWQAARADLVRVLSGKEELEALMSRRLRVSPVPPRALPQVATKVVIDNDSARGYSVIDVFTADRVGLLHRVARTLSGLSLSVDLARISTEGHRAADSFYVRTPEGDRLRGDRAERVIEAITAALLIE